MRLIRRPRQSVANSGWVQGAVFLIAGSLIIPLVADPNDIREVLGRSMEAIEWARILMMARLVTWPLAAVLLSALAVKTWRRWRLVCPPGDPWYYSCDPVLRFVGRWRRARCELPILHEAVRDFGTLRLSETMGALFEVLNTEERLGEHGDALPDPGAPPLFLLKLPARSHLAIADFVVLRLVKRIMAAGCAVLIVIVDATRFRSEEKLNMELAVYRTEHYLRRFLGSGVTIVLLSDLLLEDSRGTVHYLLRRFIPYFVSVTRQKNLSNVYNPDDYFTSLFLKGLLVRGLARRVGDRPVVVAQWEGRLDSWWDLLTTLSDWKEGMRVISFVKIRSFPDENGGALGSRSPEVALVPEGKWMAGIIGHDAEKLSDYERALADSILGPDWEQPGRWRAMGKARAFSPRRRLRQRMRDLQRGLVVGWRS